MHTPTRMPSVITSDTELVWRDIVWVLIHCFKTSTYWYGCSLRRCYSLLRLNINSTSKLLHSAHLVPFILGTWHCPEILKRTEYAVFWFVWIKYWKMIFSRQHLHFIDSLLYNHIIRATENIIQLFSQAEQWSACQANPLLYLVDANE